MDAAAIITTPERRRRSCAAAAAATDDDDVEEHHMNPFLSSSGTAPSPSFRPQFRKAVSRARWVEKAGAAEVVDNKGKLWLTTGVARGDKLYYHIEEIGYLAERGALILVDDDGAVLGMKDIYEMIARGNYGCSWDSFQAYRHLKLLGYIVGRYGVPWTMRSGSSCDVIDSAPSTENTDQSLDRATHGGSSNCIATLLEEMHIQEIYPSFEVYMLNSKFKKSSPGAPNFLLCPLRDIPPSSDELETLEKKFGGIPLKFCYVDHGRVSFFSFDRVTLPSLP